MSSNGKPFTTITLEDRTFAVVRTDPRKPQFLEVIALFLDAARARSYAEMENARSDEPAVASTEAPTRRAEPTEVISELSPRQSDVLQALRAKMDENKRVEAKVAVLAEAAHIPLGSLHSVLQSLEKKQLIKTSRAGSARAPTVYQVL
jgi:hypothetical protein